MDDYILKPIDAARFNGRVKAVLRIPGLAALIFSVLPLSGQSNPASFSFLDRGGVSLTTTGMSSALTVGYSLIESEGAAPAGFAIFGFRENDVLVSEATVPAASLIGEGRIYAEIGGSVSTGIAIANPNTQAIQIAYYFTDTSGVSSGSNTLTIPAGEQIAQFLTEPPFNAAATFHGTFTFFVLRSQPNLSVGAIALRGFINERSEFLMTTLPVTPVGERGSFSSAVLPHFASGGGWTTEVILVNPTNQEAEGIVIFTDQNGDPVTVGSDSGSRSVFTYRLAARSSWRLRTDSTGPLGVGSVRLLSTSIADIPIGFLNFSYHSGGVTVSAAGLSPSRPTDAARLFAETSGDFGVAQMGSLQTGIAISNAGSMAPVHVTYDLTSLNGASTGLQGSIDIPAGGQTAKFLGELPGLQNLPASFQGVLRISAARPVTITGLRGRFNERGDFLVTTVPPVNENDPYFYLNLQYSNFVFPHFAAGGGYTTQFVLFSGWNTGSTSGTLRSFTNSGVALPSTLLNH